MLALSEHASETLELSPRGPVLCHLALSEALVEEMPELSRSVFEAIAVKLPRLWEGLSEQIADHPLMQRYHSKQPPEITFTVLLVTNAEIARLNAQFRHKDEATDVLSFPLMEFNNSTPEFPPFPVIDLGEIYLSLPWAKQAVEAGSDHSGPGAQGVTLYLLERIVHGCLHLSGVHHETISAYNKVVAIQRSVIDFIHGNT